MKQWECYSKRYNKNAPRRTDERNIRNGYEEEKNRRDIQKDLDTINIKIRKSERGKQWKSKIQSQKEIEEKKFKFPKNIFSIIMYREDSDEIVN